ncbi:hypothetical protein J2S13_003140 [Oikeobacillus pervagus]|uniref:DUF3885 domain-containing protein n=1 Tax=Oikeobacillus pervagus TaxID=1325931 RepID=A0AAJ1T7P9_9BACI|nr:DUF3885 domain-containing protein [Oikeobacillus pervagus]MDQ0216666.1 hypothetical protein [Oikeobacillus pervagus]
MDNVFPELTLKPSLYYQCEIGIHFELARGLYQFLDDDSYNMNRFNRVYEQATTIFESLFADEDDIFLVTNVYRHKSSRNGTPRLKLYSRYLKDKSLKYKLKQETLPYVFDGEEEADQFQTLRFSLKCRKQDIRYYWLIKAICHEDFTLKPKFGSKDCAYYPDVFFINATKDIIFFIYDDRGCEVVAKDKETIRPLYEKTMIGLENMTEKECGRCFSERVYLKFNVGVSL